MKKILSAMLLIAAATGLVSAQTPVNLYGRSGQGSVGVVAAAKPEASQVGVDILKKGGNAVDAAIATAFALGVLEPNASGIGGGGFMAIKLANMKEAVIVDFRESAPAASTPDMYKFGEDGKVVGNASVVGGLAVGVPGEVAGLLYALENYGSKKLSRAQVIQPAIDWANKGIPVTVNLNSIIQSELSKINKFPACAAIYTKDGLPYEIGETIKNPDLAKTLALVAKNGKDAIYKGDIAKRIVAARLAVGSGPSAAGESSQMSSPAALPLARTRLSRRRRVSGSRPRGWGALTPGAQAEETASRQTVAMRLPEAAAKASISGKAEAAPRSARSRARIQRAPRRSASRKSATVLERFWTPRQR